MMQPVRILSLIAALFVAAASPAADKPADTARFVTTQITVEGAVENPMVLDVEALRQFPRQQIGDVPMICQSGADLGNMELVHGALLRDILEKAVVVAPEHNDVKKMVIIATASDGYRVVFSWQEVFNSPVGDGVVVFYEKGGKPLDDASGRIAMISTRDLRTGPRHVKWLSGIEVRKIVD